MATGLKPAMDPQLRASLEAVSFPNVSHLTPDVVKTMREATATPSHYLDEQELRGVSHTEIKFPSQDNSGHQIILSVLQPKVSSTKPRPCFYWMHGGGFHYGVRLQTTEFPIDVVLACDAICISVEYRMAPEYSYTTSLEDCYMGLQWVSDHTQELSIDAERLMVGGMSAGGGLAAATAIACRDRQGPKIRGLCLICPSLDNRKDSVSSQQFTEASDFWPTSIMRELWQSTLAHVPDPATVVPARVKTLVGLPTTYLDAGSAEVFRDEAVAFASRLWADGVQAELHIWAGGFHGFDVFDERADVSQTSRATKLEWVKRIWSQ